MPASESCCNRADAWLNLNKAWLCLRSSIKLSTKGTVTRDAHWCSVTPIPTKSVGIPDRKLSSQDVVNTLRS
jgi:hypothetical protein